MKTGIQISSLKPVLTTEAQVKTAFHKIAGMGVDNVQLQWIDPGVSIDFIAGCLKENGIRCVSVQDFYETVRENPSYYLTLNKATCGTNVCISRIPERLKSSDGLKKYVRELKEFRKMVRAWGQEVSLHPVSADFAPIEGIRPVEYLLEKLPDLELCVDLYHVKRSGYDMNEFLRRYGGRVKMVHFKDERAGELVPPGQGDTDWTGVVKSCIAAGVEYAFVEQERWNKDPFECLGEGLNWLNGQI